MAVRRFDFLGTTHKLETTPQGFVRVDARLTRTGIFTYHQGDTVVRELRPADEVFRSDSLKSIAGAPVMDLHPGELGAAPFVGPENARALAIGFAGEEATTDGEFVTARLTITDAKAIAGLKDGTRKEISLGYTCDVDATPGMHNGKRYDAIQRNIIVNHIALGPPGWGRARPEVCLRLDSKDAVQEMNSSYRRKDLAGSADNTENSAVGSDAQASPNMATITLNGTEFEVSEELKAPIAAEFEKRENKASDSEATGSSSNGDKTSDRLDSLKRELAKERKLRQDAQDPKVIEARVMERLRLLRQCQTVLGDVRLDGKSDREMKELVVKSAHPDAEFSMRSQAYIDGMLEAVVGQAAKKEDSLALASLASTHMAAHASTRTDGGIKQDPVHRWAEQSRNMWKQPLASGH
jgi:hypothetical protein